MDLATQTYTMTVGLGNELEVLYLEVFNGDTSARVIDVSIDDGTNVLWSLFRRAGTSTAAAGSLPWPHTGASILEGGHTRLMMSGVMRLVASVAAVAVSQDSALSLVCRIRGPVPTVVEAASAGTPVISINTERVF